MAKIYFLMLALLAGTAEAATVVTDTFTTSGSWVAPAGVFSATIQVWGGGGAGGGNTTNADGGGGGGGGGYATATVAVTPLISYPFSVGGGGIGAAGAAGGGGGASFFINATTVGAAGGSGGNPPVAGNGGVGGGGGAVTGGTGYTGGNGGTGRNNNNGQGGPGGSSAGTATVGTSGPAVWSTVTAAAPPAGGGIGGNGGGAGADGLLPASGNGGGGGGSGDTGTRTGGNGAGGMVKITYTLPASILSINCAAACTTNAGSVSWTVTFSESVASVTSGNFTLVNSGLGGTPAITGVGGSGATWTVTASTGTGNGTLGLNMANATGVTPVVANVPFIGQVHTIDKTAPTVSSIARTGPSPTVPGSVSWTVTFSESATGVDAGDFALVQAGGVSGATITGVTGGGTTWTVTANTGTGTGTVGLNLVDNDTIIDAMSNPLGGSGAGNGNFTGEVYTIVMPLTVTASPSACVNDTGIGTQPWGTLTGPLASDNAYATAAVDDNQTSNYLKCTGYGFSIPAGATINGITVSVERWANGTLVRDAAMRLVRAGTVESTDKSGLAVNYPTSDPNTYKVYGGATDQWGASWTAAEINAGNFGAALASIKNGTAGGARTVSVDHMQISVSYVSAFPAVASISRASADPTTPGAAVSWTVSFSENVTGVDAGDFALVASGMSGAVITGLTGSGTIWTVTANTGAGSGTLGLNLVDNDTIINSGGTPLGGSGVGNGNFTGEVYTIPPLVAGGFNACNVGTTCTNTTPSTYIKTKVSGSPFSLDLVALNADGTRNTGYSNTVLVELLDSSDNSAATDANQCRSSWSVIATLSPNPAFAPANNGLITVGPFSVANAYRDVRVRITNVGGPPRRGCSTDNFAIRPNSLGFVVTDGDWETAGTTRTLNNAAAPGGTVHKAGRPFSITATAYNGAATPAITTNYGGTPTASIVSHVIPTACLNGTACTLDGGTFTDGTVNDGIVSSATASYAEVGAFNMQLNDTTFAAVDAADSSTAERYITSGTVAVGRFVPDHFSLSSGAPTPACTTGGSLLSYMDQPFTLTATLLAQNFAGATTANYHPSSGGYAPATAAWQAENANSGTNLNSASTRLTNVAGAWSNGSYLVNSSTATFIRLGSPDGPYDSLQLGVLLTDPDGPTLSGLDMNATTSGPCVPCTAKTVGAPISVRFGRLRLLNAYGSELLPLRVPVRAEYFSGTTWTHNTADNCTSLPANAFALSGGLAANTSASAVALSTGSGTLTLAAPSPVAAGSVDVAANLGASGVDQSCLGSHGGTAANQSWLQFPWCAGKLDPNARVKFGASKAPYLYLRERY